MTQPQNRGCAMDDAPQIFVVCAVDDPDAYSKDDVIRFYERWAGHRCFMDKINHPYSRFNISYTIKIDQNELKLLPNDNKFIIRFRTKKHNKLNTKQYGQINIIFNSNLKVYAKYNIFRTMKAIR